jgi:hypothetical protein
MTRTQRLLKVVALSLTAVALAVPAVASASPVGPTMGSYHAPEPESGYSSPNAILGSGQTTTSPRVVVAEPADPGFSWGDAAVGASIALAVAAIGAGSLLVVRTLRADRTRYGLTS